MGMSAEGASGRPEGRADDGRAVGAAAPVFLVRVCDERRPPGGKPLVVDKDA